MTVLHAPRQLAGQEERLRLLEGARLFALMDGARYAEAEYGPPAAAWRTWCRDWEHLIDPATRLATDALFFARKERA